MKPIKVFGPAILFMPVGFFTARTFDAQLDALYAAADAPGVPRGESERLLRFIKKISQKS